jgi:hypothetical protein
MLAADGGADGGGGNAQRSGRQFGRMQGVPAALDAPKDALGGAVGLALRHRKQLLYGYLLLLHTLFYLSMTHGCAAPRTPAG